MVVEVEGGGGVLFPERYLPVGDNSRPGFNNPAVDRPLVPITSAAPPPPPPPSEDSVRRPLIIAGM